MDKDIVYVQSCSAYANLGPFKLDPKLNQKVTVYTTYQILKLPILPSLPVTPPTHQLPSQSDKLGNTNRLDSFKSNWMHKHISPKEMADAGFYFLGPEDRVRCLFCSVEIDQWESKNDAVAEHKIAAPLCIVFDENSDYDICGPYNLGEPYLNLNGDTISQYIRNFLDSVAVDQDGVFDGHKQMVSFEARFKSFHNVLKKHLHQDVNTLCEAGFIFYSIGDESSPIITDDDKMVCFCCSQGLSRWEPKDDPWIEHAIWAPHCRYLLLMKGKQFVEEIQKHIKQDYPNISVSHHESNVENYATNTVERNTYDSRVSGSNSEQTGEIDGQHEDSVVVPYHRPENVKVAKCIKCESISKLLAVNDLPKEQNSEPNTILCKICLQEKVETMFIPCGHAIACVQCAVTFDCCGICRFTVEKTMRVFPYIAEENEKNPNKLECLSLQQDEARPVDPMQCKMCYKEEMTIAFLPCRHICACFECATKIKECPLCNESYFALLQVFF